MATLQELSELANHRFTEMVQALSLLGFDVVPKQQYTLTQTTPNDRPLGPQKVATLHKEYGLTMQCLRHEITFTDTKDLMAHSKGEKHGGPTDWNLTCHAHPRRKMAWPSTLTEHLKRVKHKVVDE